MRKLFLFTFLTLWLAASAIGATVNFSLTNWISGSTSPNWIRVTWTGPYVHGNNVVISPASRTIYPVDGNFTASLRTGYYSLQVQGVPFASPVIFGVPDSSGTYYLSQLINLPSYIAALNANPDALTNHFSQVAYFDGGIINSNGAVFHGPNDAGIGLGVYGSITHHGTNFAWGFVGDGAGLTNLNAANIGSGTLPDARLSFNVPTLSGFNTWGNNNLFSANVQFDGGITLQSGQTIYDGGKLEVGSTAAMDSTNQVLVVASNGKTLSVGTDGTLYLNDASGNPIFYVAANKVVYAKGNVVLDGTVTDVKNLQVSRSLTILEPDNPLLIAASSVPPSNTTTPVAWFTVNHTNGQSYRIPLYQ